MRTLKKCVGLLSMVAVLAFPMAQVSASHIHDMTFASVSRFVSSDTHYFTEDYYNHDTHKWAQRPAKCYRSTYEYGERVTCCSCDYYYYDWKCKETTHSSCGKPPVRS